MNTLSTKINSIIKKKEREPQGIRVRQRMNKYNALKDKGLVEEEKYNVSLTDTIGYSKFGNICI